MPFTHNPVEIPSLSRETIDGVRYYTAPDSDGELIKLVSITSVTSHWSREGIMKWRKRVGDEEANRVSKRATTRGTDMHLLTEHYLQNEPLPKAKVPIAQILFNTAKPALNKIDNIIVQEQAMYSLRLGVAGTPDCIGDYDGELSIIDFKTSKSPKPLKWVEGYFVQASAYACMLYELTGIKAKKLVIIMACEDGELKVYEERDVYKWVKVLDTYIRKFVNDKLENL
jgi:ATP-dependent exoDNAse (exonuclease V) beta subunit